VARRGGLGKGLGALIPPGSSLETDVGGLEDLPTASIRPNRFQPRDHFDEESMGLLADSIREVGVLQPVLVRPVGDGYELIAGERRWRAARRIGLQTIPALVRETDDARALEHALVENLHRDDLNPLEEAAAYQQLIEDFGLTHEAVAAQVGRSRASITNALRLLQLPPSIQKLVHDGRLTMGHARALLATPDRAFQEQLAQRVVQEDLSVRAVEEAIRDRQGQASTPGADSSERRARPGRGKLRPPGLLELEELLGDYLHTRVTISMGSARGKVVVEFSTLEDLERIYRAMTAASVAERQTGSVPERQTGLVPER
jgi:ParB family chromosome partitioning protein